MNDVAQCISEEICTGCCACMNTCPYDAIAMKENAEGFLHPVVNEDKCVACGLCVQKCPVNTPKYSNTNKPECRAIWARDEIRMTAASGGVFSAFAEVLLKRGGVVCGAAYNEDFSVSHCMADKLEQLPALKSSKYIQSDAGLIYRQVEEYLRNDMEVLFSGCPCQVAGLYSYLGPQKTDKLFTMDLVCHGVPSRKVLRKYLEETFEFDEIATVDFRAKEYFGWSSNTTVTRKDGSIDRRKRDQDPFFRSFLLSLGVRESCSRCQFSCLPRQGDVTIGDFWGISRYDSALNDKKGTSLVLINNGKGKRMIRECAKLWVKNEIVPIEEGIAANKAIEKPFQAHPARKRFFDNLAHSQMKDLVEDCLSHHYDVGIAGLWYGMNYGSILTYYALNKAITDMGYQCLMINKPNNMWDRRFEDRNSIANQFIYKNCYVSNVRKNSRDWAELSQHCDTFVVGSDVVWNYRVCGKQAGHFFYLDFVSNAKKKIAYASSFGGGVSNDYEYESLSKYYLGKFDSISVREQEAMKLFQDRYQIDVEQVIDPVFLCDMKHYLDAMDGAGVKESGKFVASYFLGPNGNKKNAIVTLCDFFGLPYRNLYNPNENIEILEKRLGLNLLHDVSVEDWLYYIYHCDFFIGDSFHGLCFSLIFRKPFVVMINKDLPSRDRFDSLLKLVGLEERMVYLDTDSSRIREIARTPVNYDKVWKKLDKFRAKSMLWLQNALATNKKHSADPIDFVIEKLQARIHELEEKIR